ncbi:helix-turn-helix domain-containing protein [Facklamia hominis]|uniref:Helix-turn-helix transcriptional regulator n=1 Tax=Facklamia hominis TaxID=178214 RepID=A0AAJ1V2Y3_9LACT|nr:helix-turn-helix transcriptional regulator [Facklamia hominis]MDK7186876.1 helix-turn-helix transcriptional regulator [Facklamia hominis]
MRRNNSNLGMKIKSIRKERGLSLEDFGKLLKPPADRGQVSRWENNKNKPNNERLKSIADLAGITVDELLDDTCRWEKVDEWIGLGCKIYAYWTDCKQRFDISNLESKYSYCPYCGKKIKGISYARKS